MVWKRDDVSSVGANDEDDVQMARRAAFFSVGADGQPDRKARPAISPGTLGTQALIPEDLQFEIGVAKGVS